MSIWFLSVMKGAYATRLEAVQGRQWNSLMSALRVEGVQAQYSCSGKELHQATPLAVEHFKTIHQALHSDSERCGY